MHLYLFLVAGLGSALSGALGAPQAPTTVLTSPVLTTPSSPLTSTRRATSAPFTSCPRASSAPFTSCPRATSAPFTSCPRASSAPFTSCPRTTPSPLISSPPSPDTSSLPLPTPIAPYNPEGGLGLNTTPNYVAMSDYDWQSINLALNHEWIELDLFHHGLATFSVQDFEDAGLNAEDRHLIQFMAEQEVGHATLFTNILGRFAAKPCTYQYPFTTVREFVDFSQKLTRWSEASVYGFLEHLNSRAAAELVLQTVTIEARQQMVMRQFAGAFPMPIWFLPGITQSMAWTLLAPYLKTCPAENPRIAWQNFPALNVTNNPDLTPLFNTTITGNSTLPSITRNRSEPLSFGGRRVDLSWELPGKRVGYNNSYMTSTTAGPPRFVAWISQLNLTYTPLENVMNQTGSTIQPEARIFGPDTAPIFNGTMFVAITDTDLFLTPFNLSEINSHIVAGPAMYQAG